MTNGWKKRQGNKAERVAEQLLKQHGFDYVVNLNDTKNNNPIYDLYAQRKNECFYIDVKSTGKQRTVTLHKPHILSKIRDDDILMVFLPPYNGCYINFSLNQYILWIVPGYIERDQGLYVHNFYIEQGKRHGIDRTGSKNTKVKLKEEPNQGPTRISGKYWYCWNNRFVDAWHVFDEL